MVSFLLIFFFVDLVFVNFVRTELCKFDQIFKKLKNLLQAKIYPSEIWFKILILSLYTSDSLTGSFSTTRKNNELMVEMACWCIFWHIFSRILFLKVFNSLLRCCFCKPCYGLTKIDISVKFMCSLRWSSLWK